MKRHSKHTLCLAILTGMILQPLTVNAAGAIKRTVNADGTVEFTNVPGNTQQQASARKQTVIYKSQSGQGVVFSDTKPQYGDFEILHYSCYACNPDSRINWHTIALDTTSYKKIVSHAAKQYGVDPALVRAVIHAESSFNAQAVSNHGAEGLMQLMPATAHELGVTNAFDAKQNIEAGVKYLAQLLDEFHGNTKLATAAYNAGPNAVKSFKGVPPYAETQVYVERVGILHKRYQDAG